jgi:6-pyruvoyltetrahydropterin/6-carboxytetrahydropterin synthase
MYRISKEFSFSMGHRLSHHEGLCKNIHGHNYTVIVSLKSLNLNENGMIMDFGDLKAIVNSYLKQYYDHALMVNEVDTDGIEKLKEVIPYLKVLIVPYEPTAENMSKEIFDYVTNEVKKYNGEIDVDFVTVYETDGSQATYSKD